MKVKNDPLNAPNRDSHQGLSAQASRPSAVLPEDEELLWQGHPLSGWFINVDDLRRVTLTLVVAIILVVYIQNRGSAEAIFTVMVISLIGLLVEAYRLSFGRKKNLEQTHYALSKENIWIFTRRKTVRLPIDADLVYHLSRGTHYDSILFRQRRTLSGMSASFFKNKQNNAEISGFLNIENGDALYEAIKQQQEQNTKAHPHAQNNGQTR